VIPHLKIQNFKGQKIENKFLGVDKMCEFLEPNTKYTQGNKKRNCYVSSVDLCFCLFDSIQLGFVFFYFDDCILKLVLQILGMVNTYLMNIHKFILIFF
jgi:hypothetical protein